ncbi:signal peptidase I [Jeotgalibacillus sp. S-D1]|uniref:signal peptidase I n=1 Tax=Jeotgalibacillus sp. S-D1 TaxID=2552189 RepID=UPI001059A4E6|nr:signal peptidase I [Jeotgalibacillus sp. S-D1]TDL31298.1 signal peptidase I [Jeotgalibacillus sp. S-D1]
MSKQSKKELISWLKSILIALVIVGVCRHYLITPVTVKGESMIPTFEDDNRVIISKLTDIEAFDLIVFQSPISADKHIKRVIGLPGDEIKIKDDILSINGKIYKEPYLKQNKENSLFNQPITGDFELEVPEGSFFVMGDNRLKSMDSRSYGVISTASVIGEVKMRIYPIASIGWLD